MPIHLAPEARELDDGTFLAVVVVTDNDRRASWDVPVPDNRKPTRQEALQEAKAHADRLRSMGEEVILTTNPAR